MRYKVPHDVALMSLHLLPFINGKRKFISVKEIVINVKNIFILVNGKAFYFFVYSQGRIQTSATSFLLFIARAKCTRLQSFSTGLISGSGDNSWQIAVVRGFAWSATRVLAVCIRVESGNL